MPRDLTANFISELTADSNRPFLLFEGVFASSTLRLWTGWGNLSWDSKTWLGNGWFQSIGGIRESTEISAIGSDIVLAGVPSTLISIMLQDAQQNKEGKTYLGFLDANGAVISDPYLLYQGKLDVPTIEEDADTSSIILSYEGDLIDLDRPKEYRYTHESQQIFFPGDTGFRYVTSLQDWSGFWGKNR